MIKQCKVKNFKSLQDCEMANFKRITLLGGKNNTGKTALMEALFLFVDRLNPECFIRLHAWRGVQTIKMNSSELFGPIFYNYDTSRKIEIEITDHKNAIENLTIETTKDNSKKISLNEIDLNNLDATTRAMNTEVLKMRTKFSGSKTRKQELITHTLEGNNLNVQADDVKPNEIKTAVFLVAKPPQGDNGNALRYGDLVKENEESEILEFLKFIEPRLKSITTIQVQENLTMLYGDIGLKKKIPLNYMGDGITRILSILLAIVSTKDGIVFVDEIENGIHHSVMSDVWNMVNKASQKFNCQVIATTHSYECLSSLVVGTEATQNDISYVRLERKVDKIISKEYDYEMLQTAIEQGWEVR